MRRITKPPAAVAMNPDLIQVRALFEQALSLGDAAQRRASLDLSCAGDAALQREVESLLSAYDASGSFLQAPAGSAAPSSGLPGAGVRSFGDYELLEEIGRGGMGVVYKARQVSLNRVVAVKMILAGQLASEAEVKRFRSEAQAAASLHHSNIVGIYEVGEHQGHPYYTMPFLEGQSLAQLVESRQWKPGDGTEAARLMAKVAHAAQHAHDAGILHRDLKPGNILIDVEGEPYVTDFGLAKWAGADAHLTVTGHLLGTPGFMAPEQARGKSGHSTPATDIYSLGAVLYYLLTGRPPFVADSALDTLLLALEGEAVLPRRINPLVPGPLEHICLRCLEKEAGDRYASAGDLAMDLERFLKGEPLAVISKAVGRRFEAWAKRQPALASRICTVLLCLAIVETAYRLRNYGTLAQHRAVIAVLVVWVLVSFLFQRGLQSERHSTLVRFLWSGADPTVLTAILFIAQGFSSPLVLLYPAVIAASGFWLRVSLVTTTTGMSLLGYALLLLDTGAGTVPSHWHLLAFVAIMVTGVSVAYLVNRVSVLTQFYSRRPTAHH